MKLIILISILLLSFLHVQSTITFPVKDPNNILLTFGSCNRYYGNEPDDIFYKISEINSDLWIWLGDVAYVDEKIFPPIFGFAGEEKIKQKLENVKTSPPYAKLRETTRMIGVWDDHDYGLNNAGKDFQHKELTQRLWLEFMDEPKDSPRWNRKGVYESYYIGDETKIKVILLDVRYFKEEPSIFSPNGKDLLGEEQWKWLEDELKNSKAKYTLIGSGLQVLPDDRIIPEHWYAGNRDRLIGLIRKHKVSGVILLSGDVHYAEIMKYPCKEHVGYELYEFTSSGLTHHVATHVLWADKYVNILFPKTYNNEKDRFIDLNFGVLKFNFDKNPGVMVEFRDKNGQIRLERFIEYKKLTFDSYIVDAEEECITQESKFTRYLMNYEKALLKPEWYAYAFLLLVLFGVYLISCIVTLLVKIVRYLVRMVLGKRKEKKLKLA